MIFLDTSTWSWVSKGGHSSKVIAVPFLCNKTALFSLCTSRTNVSWSSWPLSLHHHPRPTNVKQQVCLLPKLLLCHLPPRHDGKRMVGGLVDVAEVYSRPALCHVCTGSWGLQIGKEEGDLAPNSAGHCLAHRDTSSHDEADIFTKNTPYAPVLRLALAYVQ